MSTQSALLTDIYQINMAYGYWQLQRAEREAVFQLTFRKHPSNSNYTIACGLQAVIDYLQHYQFDEQQIAYLNSLKSNQNTPLFSKDFLHYLATLRFSCDVDAIAEGTLVFPQQPLLRIKGPLLQCQLLETPLLNLMNFASLIATRASQICQIAQGDPVMEFGLRRAQGPDGALTASRAAYIGGCESTSNVLAGQQFDIPVRGTMAHSWIMSYPDEYSAFLDYVKTSDNTILLVDTYDSISGIKNAIRVGVELRKQGRNLIAIRLDSGDLLMLSKKARELLDDAGFAKTRIIASGDINAEKIAVLKKNKAPIDSWGVGTKLVTAYEQPSLDTIYKLTALYDAQKGWQYKMKLSDTPEKSTYPGILQVRRYYQQKIILEDILYDIELGIKNKPPVNADHCEDLVVPIFRKGKLVYNPPSIHKARSHCLSQVKNFNSSINGKYKISIDAEINALRQKFLMTT